MKDMATEDIFQWVTSKPKIVTASTIIFRFMDDIVSNEFFECPFALHHRASSSRRRPAPLPFWQPPLLPPLLPVCIIKNGASDSASHLSITQELKIPVSIGLFSIGGHVEKEVEIKEIRSATVLGFEDPTQDMMIL
ncbi:putative terpene synthase [Arachis hypogaea]|nr:putative terpene synthase [Arachis hypogaea]